MNLNHPSPASNGAFQGQGRERLSSAHMHANPQSSQSMSNQLLLNACQQNPQLLAHYQHQYAMYLQHHGQLGQQGLAYQYQQPLTFDHFVSNQENRRQMVPPMQQDAQKPQSKSIQSYKYQDTLQTNYTRQNGQIVPVMQQNGLRNGRQIGHRPQSSNTNQGPQYQTSSIQNVQLYPRKYHPQNGMQSTAADAHAAALEEYRFARSGSSRDPTLPQIGNHTTSRGVRIPSQTAFGSAPGPWSSTQPHSAMQTQTPPIPKPCPSPQIIDLTRSPSKSPSIITATPSAPASSPRTITRPAFTPRNSTRTPPVHRAEKPSLFGQHSSQQLSTPPATPSRHTNQNAEKRKEEESKATAETVEKTTILSSPPHAPKSNVEEKKEMKKKELKGDTKEIEEAITVEYPHPVPIHDVEKQQEIEIPGMRSETPMPPKKKPLKYDGPKRPRGRPRKIRSPVDAVDSSSPEEKKQSQEPKTMQPRSKAMGDIAGPNVPEKPKQSKQPNQLQPRLSGHLVKFHAPSLPRPNSGLKKKPHDELKRKVGRPPKRKIDQADFTDNVTEDSKQSKRPKLTREPAYFDNIKHLEQDAVPDPRKIIRVDKQWTYLYKEILLHEQPGSFTTKNKKGKLTYSGMHRPDPSICVEKPTLFKELSVKVCMRIHHFINNAVWSACLALTSKSMNSAFIGTYGGRIGIHAKVDLETGEVTDGALRCMKESETMADLDKALAAVDAGIDRAKRNMDLLDNELEVPPVRKCVYLYKLLEPSMWQWNFEWDEGKSIFRPIKVLERQRKRRQYNLCNKTPIRVSGSYEAPKWAHRESDDSRDIQMD